MLTPERLDEFIYGYHQASKRAAKRVITNLEHFSWFLQTQRERQIWRDKLRFDALFEGARAIRSTAERMEAKVADGYNIFKVLYRNPAALYVHTNVIANLLDTDENHAQGRLFNKRFWAYAFPQRPTLSHFFMNQSEMDCFQSYQTQAGKVDLQLVPANPEVPFCVHWVCKSYQIQNAEHLSLYVRNLENMNLSKHRAVLFFLTRQAEPIDLSIYDQSPVLVSQLSLVQQIIPWLNDCIDDLEADSVREVIIQYIKFLQS